MIASSKTPSPPKPVRNIIRGSPHRVVGQIAWVKGGHRMNVPWESRPERDAAKIMAADSRVLTLHAQPFTVTYRLDGKSHEYTPDFKVVLRTKPFILEVKEFADASTPENQARFSEIARVLAGQGYEFKVWTEREYRREPLLSNSTYVLRFRAYPFDEIQAVRVTALLAKHTSLAFSVLQAELNPALTLEALFAMACFGLIYVDCGNPFGLDPVFHNVPVCTEYLLGVRQTCACCCANYGCYIHPSDNRGHGGYPSP